MKKWSYIPHASQSLWQLKAYEEGGNVVFILTLTRTFADCESTKEDKWCSEKGEGDVSHIWSLTFTPSPFRNFSIKRAGTLLCMELISRTPTISLRWDRPRNFLCELREINDQRILIFDLWLNYLLFASWEYSNDECSNAFSSRKNGRKNCILFRIVIVAKIISWNVEFSELSIFIAATMCWKQRWSLAIGEISTGRWEEMGNGWDEGERSKINKNSHHSIWIESFTNGDWFLNVFPDRDFYQPFSYLDFCVYSHRMDSGYSRTVEGSESTRKIVTRHCNHSVSDPEKKINDQRSTWSQIHHHRYSLRSCSHTGRGGSWHQILFAGTGLQPNPQDWGS